MKYSIAVLALLGMCINEGNTLKIRSLDDVGGKGTEESKGGEETKDASAGSSQKGGEESKVTESTTTETKSAKDEGATPSTVDEKTSADPSSIKDAADSSVSSTGSGLSPCH